MAGSKKKNLGVWRIVRDFFRLDYILCTALVFALMYGFKDLFERTNFLNPIETALSDFEMSDMIYSVGIRDQPGPDTNIVLVNIGNLPRRLIARQIEAIAAQKPKALGIDASFVKDLDPYGDSLLDDALGKVDNLVMYGFLNHKEKSSIGPFDTLELCNPRFARHGVPGFVNLITPGKDEFHVCRTFSPIDSVAGKKYLCFALQMAWYEDSLKVKEFLSRNNSAEIINFRGNSNYFYNMDCHHVLGRDDASGFYQPAEIPVNLKGKIVFMGFMGGSFEEAPNTVSDKFHTPLNERYAGKSYPDMFGVTIHANIASMVLRGKPTDSMGFGGYILLAVILCYLNVVFFFYIHEYYPTSYDLVVKTIQIVQVGLVLYLSIYIHGVYNYKIEVSTAAFALGFSGDVLEVYVGIKEKIVAKFRRIFA
jgi:CHASE2 domain-containing sensor protein